MRFSILIPVYNVENYLARCLESVLAQTYTDYEVILVDDGSTDGSSQLCDRFVSENSKNFQVIHKENQGLLSARRIALAEAKGDFVCFLDSDDYWAPDLLEQVNGVICTYNPDIVVFGNTLIGYEGSIIATQYPNFEKSVYEDEDMYILRDLIVKGTKLNQLWKKVIRLSIIDRENNYLPFYHVSSGEDQLQTLPMLDRASRVVILNQCLYNYCINRDSITQSKASITQIESLVTVYKELGIYVQRWGIDPKLYHQRFGNILIIILKSMIIHRFGDEAFTKKELDSLLQRCKAEDIRLFLILYDPAENVFPYSTIISAMKADRNWLVKLLISVIGMAYSIKKYAKHASRCNWSKKSCGPRM